MVWSSRLKISARPTHRCQYPSHYIISSLLFSGISFIPCPSLYICLLVILSFTCHLVSSLGTETILCSELGSASLKGVKV